MARKRPKKSPEAMKQEVEDLTKGIERSVEQHFHSTDQLKAYLRFMGQFHDYSRNNVQLMQSQFPGAEAVGSFKFWKEKGAPVQKGEKGIKILVPQRLGEQFQNEEGKWKPVKHATKEEKSNIEDGQLAKREGRLVFSTGTVFDVSQTSAKAKDLPSYFPNKWMEGKVEDYGQLRSGMEAIANENGISIIEPKQELGAAKGVSYTLTKEVALNPRNSERQDVKSLLHELAHAKLHTAETSHHYSKPEKEFQAEMTAYTVASHFGVDTSDYSLDYLKHWTKGRSFDDHQQLLKEVQDTSHQFITTMERSLEPSPEKEQEQNQSKGDDPMIHQSKGPVTAQPHANRSVQPEEREQTTMMRGESPLLQAYRNEVKGHTENKSPFEKEDGKAEHHSFKDVYKREIMTLIEPGVGKQIDREESGDRQQRLQQMRDFEKNHDPQTVYALKKESLQEVKDLPLSEQGQKRLDSLEKQLDEAYTKDHEKTSQKSAERSNERERRDQKEPAAASSISSGTQTGLKGPEPDM